MSDGPLLLGLTDVFVACFLFSINFSTTLLLFYAVTVSVLVSLFVVVR